MKANNGPSWFWQNKYPKPAATKVLLVTDVFVGSDQKVKITFSGVKQSAIFQFGPTHLRGGLDVVRSKVTPQWSGRSLIKKDSHPARMCSSSPKGAFVSLARKPRTSSTCERSTSNQSEISSRLAPALRLSRTTQSGRRVPRNNQTPLTLPGIRSTAGHFDRSIIAQL